MSSSSRPFNVIVPEDAAPVESLPQQGDGDLSMEDIEAAYLLAMEAADVAIATPVQTLGDSPSEATLALNPARPAPTSAVKQRLAGREDLLPVASHPRQIVEAFLFVGYEPISTARLQDLLGGRMTQQAVDELVEQLNDCYVRQRRPYEIVLLEAGYRLQLRPEFEAVRRRVHGQGPKDVKLSQDVLEVLSLIAYRQPLSRQELGETGRENLGEVTRQLLRRQLIQLERDEQQQDRFRTTPRFLELFGLRTLADLPRAVDFQFK